MSDRVKLTDGVELSLTLHGEDSANAPRVVLVHSLALDRTIWTAVAERLAEAGTGVLTYDCRGHGASTRAPGPYGLELFAADLASLLDTVGWGSAIVAGASMGGNVAQAFAVAYPERVQGLALVDTTAWYGPDAAARWAERANQGREKGLEVLVEFQLSRWFSDAFRAAHPDVARHFAEVFVANDVSCYAASCEMLGAFDLRQAISQVRVPTVILVGDEDYATPLAMAQQLHDLIAGSTLEVLTGARHLTPVEQPDQVADAIARLSNGRTPHR